MINEELYQEDLILNFFPPENILISYYPESGNRFRLRCFFYCFYQEVISYRTIRIYHHVNDLVGKKDKKVS